MSERELLENPKKLWKTLNESRSHSIYQYKLAIMKSFMLSAIKIRTHLLV